MIILARFEDPSRCCSKMLSQDSHPRLTISLIHDRRQAIAYAINNAACKDTVLIAGKGHEAVQIINGEQVHFDDKKIATLYLQNYH